MILTFILSRIRRYEIKMRLEHLKYLACPTCSEDLEVDKIEMIEKDSIESRI